tara:strand:+ start:1252 stop:1521 length:270 start_codon:yes stop_codon:yes gene_type:complete
MEMPKSTKKVMNIGEFRTMSFPCGKEAVQGSIPRMKLMRKLHEKTCDICSKTESVIINRGNVNNRNGISGRNAGFTNLKKYTKEEKNLE